MKEKRKLAILHISDLHIVNNSAYKKAYTNEKKEYSTQFISTFIDKLKQIKQEKKIDDIIFIVSGDLSESGKEKEYDKVIDFLDEITKELNIDKQNILIVPGNHDINRIECILYNEGNEKKFSNENEAKFKTFSQFYKKFKGEDFDCGKLIINNLEITSKNINILCINTCLNDSHRDEDHYGYLNPDALKNELKEAPIEKDAFNISIMHHSPVTYQEISPNTIKNWTDIKSYFENYNIFTFFYGHIHAGQVKTEEDSECISYIGVKKFYEQISKSGFHFFIEDTENTDSNKFIFKRESYFLIGDDYDETLSYSWNIDESPKLKSSIILRKKGNIRDDILKKEKEEKTLDEGYKLLPDEKIQLGDVKETIYGEGTTLKDLIFSDKIISQKLYDYVLKYNLVKEGHYHFGKSRTRDWIDTNFLLSNYECSNLVRQSLIKIINNKSIELGLVVGIGMEGNIMGALMTELCADNYTYMPNPIKNDNFISYEMKLPDKSNIYIVTLLIDVVHSGDTINNVVSKIKEQYKEIANINLITIFKTSDTKIKGIQLYCLCDCIKIHSCNQIDCEECFYKKHNKELTY